jgi:rhamnogalacturonan endolyase
MRMGISKNVTVGANDISLDREMLPKGAYTVKVKLDGKFVQKGMFKN